jgi:hypothetical protein
MSEINTDCLNSIDGNYIIVNPTLAAINKEADNIQKVLEKRINIDTDVGMLPYRLEELDAQLARLGDLISRSKAMKDFAKKTLIEQNPELEKMTATNSNRIMSSAIFEFTMTVDRLESLYGATYQICKDISSQMYYIQKQMGMK